ncbi:MAG: class I SAM-dependent methyltransferase [Sphingobacteriales bacterium]|nr:class I SAM-dependent methyltransferase [Sphingobacteriales bacterium]
MDNNAKAVDLFNRFAEMYAAKFNDLSIYQEALNLFCDQLPSDHPTVLDVACGSGLVARTLLDNRKDIRLTGIDMAPKMLELAQALNPEAGFLLMDARNLDQFSGTFDGICCAFCLPYFNKEETMNFIKQASTLLMQNGVLYISTMEDAYEKSDWKTGSTGEALFIHYYEAEWLEKILIENGFEILLLSRKVNPIPSASNTTDLMIVAKKIIFTD